MSNILDLGPDSRGCTQVIKQPAGELPGDRVEAMFPRGLSSQGRALLMQAQRHNKSQD